MYALSIQTHAHLFTHAPLDVVLSGVFRSSFPRSKNTAFLKCLNLKSVVSLVLEDYPTALVDFYDKSGTELITLGIEGNKGAFKEIDIVDFNAVMRTVMDESKRPLLIHCNKGKHRTGCIVGCIRRLRGWAVSAIVDEYMLFAFPKPRQEDQRFIEAFSCDDFYDSFSAIPDEDCETLGDKGSDDCLKLTIV